MGRPASARANPRFESPAPPRRCQGRIRPAGRAQGANRSPCSPTRSSTSSNRNCSRPSGVAGAGRDLVPGDRCGDVGALPAAQGVRRDRGLGAGVLRPVEEDLAGPLGLGHRGGDLLRVLLLELLGHRPSPARVDSSGLSLPGSGGVEVQALAAAGDRLAPRGPARPARSRTSSATSQHSGRPAGSPGSRSMTSRFGLRGCPLRPTVHWWTCSSSAARLTSQVSVARSSTIGKTRWSPCLDSPARARGRHLRGAHPRRRTGGGVLLEERLVGDAVRPADPGDGAVLEVRQQDRRDLGVVVEHLALGGAGAGVEHLAEVADLERAALDVDVDLLPRGHQEPIAITGTRSWSSRGISRWMNQRGALTQPAVAPEPFTCRKIAPPRWRTCAWLNVVTIENSYCFG